MNASFVGEQVSLRYRAIWALRDCTFALPEGSITALVGPNGSGKSTLLHLGVGLLAPTGGDVIVCGARPHIEPERVLPRVGFVAQDHPLYRSFTLEEVMTMGRLMNSQWDDEFARSRLRQLGLPLKRRCGQLSGGQQAQVALVLALAKRPELLLLDEPVASLDPLARHELLSLLLETVVARGTSVVVSSHIIFELERVCDRLLLLTAGQVRLQGPIDEVLGEHARVIGEADFADALHHQHTVISMQQEGRQVMAIVRLNGPIFGMQWQTVPLSLDELVLAYLAQDRQQEMAEVSA